MTAPTLRSATQSQGYGTSHTVAMPSTVSSGDLLIALLHTDGTPTVTWDHSTYGAWTKIITETAASSSQAVVYAKIATGAEASGTISITTSNIEEYQYRVLAYRDWGGSLSTDVVTDYSVALTQFPDPPASTDSWCTVDRCTVAACTSSRASVPVSAYPSGYGNTWYQGTTGVDNGAWLATCDKSGNEGAQDPGTFTIESVRATVQMTISIKGVTSGGLPTLSSPLLINPTVNSLTPRVSAT